MQEQHPTSPLDRIPEPLQVPLILALGSAYATEYSRACTALGKPLVDAYLRALLAREEHQVSHYDGRQ